MHKYISEIIHPVFIDNFSSPPLSRILETTLCTTIFQREQSLLKGYSHSPNDNHYFIQFRLEDYREPRDKFGTLGSTK